MSIFSDFLDFLFDGDSQSEESRIEEIELERMIVRKQYRLDKARIVSAKLDLLSMKIKEDMIAAKDNSIRIKSHVSLLRKVIRKGDHPFGFVASIEENIKFQERALFNEREGIESLKKYYRFASAHCSCRDGKVKCPSCRGVGEKRERVECNECDGSGWDRGNKCTCIGGYAWSDAISCKACAGTGWCVHKTCEGTGRKNYKRVKKVLLSAMPDGMSKIKIGQK